MYHNGHTPPPPPPPTFLQGSEVVEPPTKFSKRGDLAGPQLLEGGRWKKAEFPVVGGRHGGAHTTQFFSSPSPRNNAPQFKINSAHLKNNPPPPRLSHLNISHQSNFEEPLPMFATPVGNPEDGSDFFRGGCNFHIKIN